MSNTRWSVVGVLGSRAQVCVASSEACSQGESRTQMCAVFAPGTKGRAVGERVDWELREECVRDEGEAGEGEEAEEEEEEREGELARAEEGV